MHTQFFLTEDTDDPLTAGARTIIAGEYAIFSRFSREDLLSFDFDETVRTYMAATGKTKRAVEHAIFAYNRLYWLPGLRALQDERRLLDLPRLSAADDALNRLGPDPDPAILAAVDELLVGIFTPKRARQQLPGPATVSQRVNALLGQMNPTTDCNAKRRKEREDKKAQRPEETTSLEFYEVTEDGQERAGVQIDTDQAVMTSFKLRIALMAKEAGISLAEAVEEVLTGTVPASKVVLYGYTPLNHDGQRDPGAPIYLQGEGWLGGDAVATIEEWMEHTPTQIVDLNEVRERVGGGYAPTEAMRAFAVARDGVCIFPGCNVPAQRCQLDHRIPFEDGGATTPDNLFSLCQHHHNEKTDRRAFYIPDPVSGDIIWLFADGTYQVTEPSSLFTQQITPVAPRWAETMGARKRRKAKNAQFFATGHRILDDYLVHRNAARCAQEIAELEAAFKMTFEFPMDELPEELFPDGLDGALARRPVERLGDLQKPCEESSTVEFVAL